MKQHELTRPNVIRRRQVEQRTGLTRSALYQLMRSGEFPEPVHISVRAVGWIEAEVDDWIRSRMEKRNQAALSGNQA